MDESPRPTAAMRRWRWATIATTSFSAGVTLIYATILVAIGDGTIGWLLPRLMQLAVYLSAMAAVACATRLNIEGTRALIDRRVSEAAARMDRRMDAIANGMVEHGIRLDDITAEIPRARQAVREHTRAVREHVHSHHTAVYGPGPGHKMTAVG